MLALPPLDLRAEQTASQFQGYVSTWSALPNLIRAGGAPEFEQLRRELTAAWGAPDRRRRVVWPLAGRVGRVR